MNENKMVFVRKINADWMLCDIHGRAVDDSGNLTYYPYFYKEKPEGITELIFSETII